MRNIYNEVITDEGAVFWIKAVSEQFAVQLALQCTLVLSEVTQLIITYNADKKGFTLTTSDIKYIEAIQMILEAGGMRKQASEVEVSMVQSVASVSTPQLPLIIFGTHAGLLELKNKLGASGLGMICDADEQMDVESSSELSFVMQHVQEETWQATLHHVSEPMLDLILAFEGTLWGRESDKPQSTVFNAHMDFQGPVTNFPQSSMASSDSRSESEIDQTVDHLGDSITDLFCRKAQLKSANMRLKQEVVEMRQTVKQQAETICKLKRRFSEAELDECDEKGDIESSSRKILLFEETIVHNRKKQCDSAATASGSTQHKP